MIAYRAVLVAMSALALGAPAQAGTIADARVQRGADGALTVAWTDADPVDVFVTADPAGDVAHATRLADDDRNGRYTLAAAGTDRRYFLLRDGKSGRVTMVAERLLPLEQGSNFRDIGGYPAAGGKHVRWGMIYRSGATPLLNAADLKQVQGLRLANMIDLRSSEERVLAPSRIEGVPYTAVGYSLAAMMRPVAQAGAGGNGSALYRTMPVLLAPQLRIVFADLLADKGAVAYNCSAGQDRTGFVTAMILSALGTPRDVILADYHLSTTYRRPQYEMPRIDLAAHPNDPAAAVFARHQDDPRAAVPRPLKEADGTPYLAAAFAEIDARWGSVNAYLDKEIGLDTVKRAALRRIYLQ